MLLNLNNLLDFAQLVSGAFALHVAAFNVETLLYECLELIAMQA